ncbi:MAG TPA: serine/threonine-protein kinase [Aggregatilineales bacterium]|nr:serine/threonine-protein kinase [Aggregatilineales bacterium]
MLITLRNGQTEQYEDEPFASGAQGTLHLSRDKRWVVKLYHDSKNARIGALTKVINEFNVTRNDKQSVHLFAWPDAIVDRPKVGVRMANVNFEVEHKSLTWWIGPRAFKRLGPEIRGTWLDRVIVAVNMARISWKLHSNGLCHSDFSGDNFLANMTRQHVVLIDLDNLVVPGVLPPEMLGTGDYMAPEIVMGRNKPNSGAKPAIETDLHSLAVLIYQLLLMRHPLKGPKQHHADAEQDDLLALGKNALYTEDPQDWSNHPAEPFRSARLLGEEVEGLMRQAFTAGLHNPHQRPLAPQWSDALLRMSEQIIPCPNVDCEGKAFVLLRDQPAVCPWCETRVNRPAQVPVLRLYDSAGQVGHFQPGRGRVVGWQNRTLNRWHVQSGISASTTEDRDPVAMFHYKQKAWMIENLSIPDFRVAEQGSVRQVSVSETLTLHEGQQLVMGSGNRTRLATVTMQRL